MSNPKAMAVSSKAADYVLSDSPPLYSEMDCYKFVRQCVMDAGGEKMPYAGSNDVFRNGCTEVMPLKDAIAQDKLKSGWVLFIVEAVSTGTPEKYRNDGKGDASHMGLYTDLTNQETGEYVEVAHSSASRGKVAASTLKNAWNWAGKLKHVDYSDWEEKPSTPTTQYAVVEVEEGSGLRMRKTPSAKGAYMQKVPKGAELVITSHQNGFAQTEYKGYTGWVDERYLRYLQEDVKQPAEDVGAMEKLWLIYEDLGRWLGVNR